MKRIVPALFMLLVPALGWADVVTLECKGTNPAGEEQTITVRFDETAGWVDDNGMIKIRDGVSADRLRGFNVVVERQTGEYSTFRPSTPAEDFKGTCKLMDRKF